VDGVVSDILNASGSIGDKVDLQIVEWNKPLEVARDTLGGVKVVTFDTEGVVVDAPEPILQDAKAGVVLHVAERARGQEARRGWVHKDSLRLGLCAVGLGVKDNGEVDVIGTEGVGGVFERGLEQVTLDVQGLANDLLADPCGGRVTLCRSTKAEDSGGISSTVNRITARVIKMFVNSKYLIPRQLRQHWQRS